MGHVALAPLPLSHPRILVIHHMLPYRRLTAPAKPTPPP